MNTPAPVEVLIRSTDAIRDSWLYVNWLDNPGHDTYRNIPAAVLNQIQTRLASALMVAQSGETEEQAARRALTTGPFATRDGERDLATYLSSVLLPDTFWHQLANHTHNEVLVRITPSRRLAHVPWELLTLPDGTRLIEHVTITYEVASTIHYHRDPLPTPWEDFHDRPGLATIDPAVHELTNTFRPTLSGPEPVSTQTVTPTIPSTYDQPTLNKPTINLPGDSPLAFLPDTTTYLHPDQAATYLQALASELHNHPEIHVTITGRTANGTTRWASLKALGQARADTVNAARTSRPGLPSAANNTARF